jgi:uncharacterized protein YceH (UPF0502 family)
LFLYKAIIIASPIAASAAATVIMKNTNICPFRLPKKDEKVTNTKFTELSISSMHIKTTIAFLLIRTPTTPVENNRSAKMRKKFISIYKNNSN